MENTNDKYVGAINALNLLRYKASLQADRSQPIIIDEDDVNAILIVAGMEPVYSQREAKP